MEFAEYIKTPKVEGVIYYASDEPYHGALCLTGHHTIMYADDASRKEVWILHKNVDMVEKRLGVDSGLLCLHCKDFTQYQFQIPGVDNTNNIQSSVETLSSVVDPPFLYPMFYRSTFPIDVDGWEIYSIDQEYATVCSKSDDWRVSSVNKDFALCWSYPRQLIVPKTITDEALKKSSSFRQSGRIPVLAYCHSNGAALVRCGQPLLGSNNRRSRDDEKLLNACLGSAGRGYIIDLRSLQTAQAAKLKGGGYEMEAHYPRWKRIHQPLQSYQILQESVTKLSEGSRDANASMEKWLNKLESSNWQHHVKETLAIACLAAQCIDKERWSVVVHGHEGIDGTLCITSLAQVILDPDCRTINGLIGMIEREWLRAGHPFAIRNSKATGSGVKTKGEGPLFSLFLECMYQLVQQFPLSFEFVPSMLLLLRSHSYASQFGTFICSNDMERSTYKVDTKTISLWSHLLRPSVCRSYTNMMYKRRNTVIWPSVAPQSIDVWEELYIPWMFPDTRLCNLVNRIYNEHEELLQRNSRLSDRVKDFETLIGTKMIEKIFVDETRNEILVPEKMLNHDDSSKFTDDLSKFTDDSSKFTDDSLNLNNDSAQINNDSAKNQKILDLFDDSSTKVAESSKIDLLSNNISHPDLLAPPLSPTSNISVNVATDAGNDDSADLFSVSFKKSSMT